MPCKPCPNGKWKWGNNGKCIYDTKNECDKAGIAIITDKLNKLREYLQKT